MSSPIPPPEHADRLADLGAPIAEFRVGWFVFFLLTWWTISAVVIALFLGLIWLWLVFDPQFANLRPWLIAGSVVVCVVLYVKLHRSGKLSRSGKAMLHLGHFLGFGLLGLATAAAGWRRMRQSRGLRVIVYPAGFARIQGDRVEVVRWEEITTVRRAFLWNEEKESPLHSAIRLTLGTADGREYEFDEALSGLKALRQHVEEYTLPHLLHPALDACEAGHAVSFGKLSACRQGLVCDGVSLAWELCESVKTAKIAKGNLIVKCLGARRPFWKIPLLQLQNVHVLIALAEYFRRYGF